MTEQSYAGDTRRNPLTRFVGEALLSRLTGGGLSLLVVLISAVIMAPLIGILLAWPNLQVDIWSYLYQTQLFEAVGNTLFLLIAVLLMSGVLGVGLAWLNSVFVYPGRSWLQYALVLPLAVPVYVFAFAFLGLFGVGGTVQNYLAQLLSNYQQTDVRSLFSLSVIMALALFPYVYLLMRNAFLTHGVELYEVARTLGLSPQRAFLQTVLPAVRPVLIAALFLVGMETIAEFGAASIFNYTTLTTAIYKTWFGLLNFAAAAQLASLLLLFVLLLLVSERMLRGRARYVDSVRNAARMPRRITGISGVAAFALSFGVFTLGFILPIGQLTLWALQSGQSIAWQHEALLRHTIALSLMVTGVAVPLGLILIAISHWRGGLFLRAAVRLAGLGYAVPGTVLAVGVVSVAGIVATRLDISEYGWLSFMLPGSLVILVIACTSRLMALVLGTLEGAFKKIRPSLTETALVLGQSRIDVLRRIYIPLILPALAVAALLVFVETMREMPMTLLLRPMGWNTMAVQIFNYTTEGEWQSAALPALVLVLVGLIPVLMAMRRQYPVRHRSN